MTGVMQASCCSWDIDTVSALHKHTDHHFHWEQTGTRQLQTEDFAPGEVCCHCVLRNSVPHVEHIYDYLHQHGTDVDNANATCHMAHFGKTWRHPQNRKNITYYTLIRWGPSKDPRFNICRKFWREICDSTDKHTRGKITKMHNMAKYIMQL